ncbi:hypothetical protein [Bradyrhizobium canariense]|uniref:hypothetical protein n=1 Tax=Bradyrhizobium canariense TaxID=255045 RepID=UPI001B8A4014|nr:hypothetical protein [Bradyrhizobium canariense]MBR0955303.1 hypothetical protein [Bradyrhizobium canariense]
MSLVDGDQANLILCLRSTGICRAAIPQDGPLESLKIHWNSLREKAQRFRKHDPMSCRRDAGSTGLSRPGLSKPGLSKPGLSPDIAILSNSRPANSRREFSFSRQTLPELCFVAPPSKPRGRREGRVPAGTRGPLRER